MSGSGPRNADPTSGLLDVETFRTRDLGLFHACHAPLYESPAKKGQTSTVNVKLWSNPALGSLASIHLIETPSSSVWPLHRGAIITADLPPNDISFRNTFLKGHALARFGIFICGIIGGPTFTTPTPSEYVVKIPNGEYPEAMITKNDLPIYKADWRTGSNCMYHGERRRTAKFEDQQSLPPCILPTQHAYEGSDLSSGIHCPAL